MLLLACPLIVSPSNTRFKTSNILSTINICILGLEISYAGFSCKNSGPGFVSSHLIYSQFLIYALLIISRLKKRIVSRAIFLKTGAAGRLFILIFMQQKTDAGTFLLRKYQKWSRE